METIELYSCEELMDFIIQGIKDKKNSSDFKKEHIQNLSNKLSAARDSLRLLTISKEVILFSDYSIEIPIYFPQRLFNTHFFYRSDITPLVGYDDINKIRYEMSNPSIEYSLLMMHSFKDFCNKKEMIIEDQSIHHILGCYLKSFTSTINNDDNNLIRSSFSTLTIKISTKEKKSLGALLKFAESFKFQTMHDSNIGCVYFYNMFDILQQSNFHNGRSHSLRSIPTLPRRIYRDHIIDYYSLALSSTEPFAQYLSYYHVVEYFFDEVFNNNLRTEFQRKITHPNFSYKDNKALDKIINFIKKETRSYKENGQGNEFESLKQVLKKFVDINELQEKLTSEQIEYFQKNQVSFSHAPTISFKDKEGFCNNLAQRIYQTRNSLVHSKEGNVGRYKPYQDSEELSKEIPLIKLIAELVIINSSDPL